MISWLQNILSKRLKQRKMEKKGLIGSRKRRKAEEGLRTVVDKSWSLGILILLLVWFTSAVVILLPSPKSVAKGWVEKQHATETVFVDFDFPYEAVEKTALKRREAREATPLYYRVKNTYLQESKKKINRIFEQIKQRVDLERAGKVYKPKPNDPIEKLVASLNPGILNDLMQIILNSEKRDEYLERMEISIERGIMNPKDREERIYGQKASIIDTLQRISKPRQLAKIPVPAKTAEELADKQLEYYPRVSREKLRPALIKINLAALGNTGNLVFDKAMTDSYRKTAEEKVQPVMKVVKKGEPLINRDQKLTAVDIKILEDYYQKRENLTAAINFWQKFAQTVIITMLMIIITGVYIYHIHPEVVRSNQKIWVIGIVAILAMLINYFMLHAFQAVRPIWGIPQLGLEVIPLALAAVLLSVLIGLRVAVYAGLFTAMVAAQMVGNAEQFSLLIIEGLMVSCLAGFMVRNSTNYRSFFFRCVFTIFIVFLLFDYKYVWKVAESPQVLGWSVGLSFFNSIFTSVLALILLFAFEMIFNISTNMSLLMLCDYNHPLLKRLQLEAPGTYHHSLMVATLSEQAALDIGADPIRVRVCALFHDIGKLVKPEYFTENNIAVEAKHRELHPRMSSLIILNHVKEGVDLAIKHKLRKIIRDGIQQHHGTDLVMYFYKRAIEENRDKANSVEEQEYRYPGPLPKEKEVVIISLADACEAASRTLQKPSPGKIDALVWEIFRNRIRNGQLNSADLTFGELAKVRKSFAKTLTTMLHGRIAYPKDEENEEDEDDLFVASKKASAAEQEKIEKPAEKSS